MTTPSKTAESLPLRKNQSVLVPFEEDIFAALKRGVSLKSIQQWLKAEHDVSIAFSTLWAWVDRRKKARAKFANDSQDQNASSSFGEDINKGSTPNRGRKQKVRKQSPEPDQKASAASQPVSASVGDAIEGGDPFAASLAMVKKSMLSK